MIARALAALALIAGAAGPATADPPRPTHGGFGGGTYLGLTGADWGPVGTAELYPGGGFGRYGVRGEIRGYEGLDAGQATLGVVYEAASARPRLSLALYADAGLSWNPMHPVVGAGVQTHLWLWGPLAIVTGAGLSLRVAGTADTALAVTGSSQLRLAW